MKRYTKLIAIIISIAFNFANFANAHGNDSSNPANHNEMPIWMKFKAKDKYERSKIADLGITIDAVVDDMVAGMGSREQLEDAKKLGLLVTHFPMTAKMLDFPNYDSLFHNYTELTAALQKLATENSDIVKLSSIGRSLEGREIHLLTISKDADDKSRPAVFFMGGHHAREHLSVEMPLRLAQYLVTEFRAGNTRIVNLINNRTIYFAPVVNPDGKEYDIATGSYQLWRKNRRSNGGTFGVDLNRNYGFGWGGGGASTNPGNDTYRGPAAFSEPETQAVKQFFESHDNINICLSYHTFSELILYPWGHKYDSIEKQSDFLVHKTMAETMAGWNGYTPQQSSELYIASGDTTDWSYGQLGVISFTFELDPKMTPDMNWEPGRGFYPGQSRIETVVRKNIEPALYLIEYSDNPYRVIEQTHTRYGFQSPVL